MRDGAWLQEQEFPPLAYAVPGVAPEGSSLLVGPPKIGKSYFVLGLGVAIASGGVALSAIKIGPARPVLYLALEDGHRLDPPSRLPARRRLPVPGLPRPTSATGRWFKLAKPYADGGVQHREQAEADPLDL